MNINFPVYLGDNDVGNIVLLDTKTSRYRDIKINDLTFSYNKIKHIYESK
jgi:hypothetical protein